jgi:predicted Zn-dependent peptidase
MLVDRKTAPGFVKSTSFNLIQPVAKTLPNGIDLFFIHGGFQDVIKIELLFNAGRWFETQLGVSHFTSHQLSKGTRSKNSFEIAQLFDRYGAHLEVNAGMDTVSISIYTLTKNLQPVIMLLQEILQEPSFPEKELDQAKSIYIQNLKVNLEKTSFLSSKHFRKRLFGNAHPYGKELEEADINNLQQKNLSDYFHSFFQHLSVFVSGRFDTANEKMIMDIFSSWQTKQASKKNIGSGSLQPVHEHIEKEGSVQSSIRMGNRSLMRAHPDYPKAIFVSHLLGGYFGSRLMKNIREEKGLTYGIHASIHSLKHDSYLIIGADVNKENVSLTFEEIRKELRRLRSEKISAHELETARNHFIGSLQSEITTPFAHADKLKTIYLFGLPADYYQQMIFSIDHMDHLQIMEIGEKYFHEETCFEIAVG